MEHLTVTDYSVWTILYKATTLKHPLKNYNFANSNTRKYWKGSILHTWLGNLFTVLLQRKKRKDSGDLIVKLCEDAWKYPTFH